MTNVMESWASISWHFGPHTDGKKISIESLRIAGFGLAAL